MLSNINVAYRQKATADRNMTIIAIEGLACVGKTSAATMLADTIRGARLIEEVMPNVVASVCSAGPFAGAFYINDLWKASCAEQVATANQICILDRYYVSTVSHYLARRGAKCDVAEEMEVARKIIGDYYLGVPRPDLWIYVVSDPEEAWERYCRLRVVDSGSEWASREGTLRIHAAMHAMLTTQEIGNVLSIRSEANIRADALLGAILNIRDN